jgi:hypothetical protein
MSPDQSGDPFEAVAIVSVDEVRASGAGFVLAGRGTDQQDYRVELHFDVPVDAKTRKVLGELLSEAELRVLRRTPPR